MTLFNYRWVVRAHDERELVNCHDTGAHCRDSAYHDMTVQLYNIFCISALGYRANTEKTMLMWKKWALENVHGLKFECDIALCYGDIFEHIIEYDIPRVISKLVNKYSTVQFTPIRMVDDFSGDSYPGIRMCGDVQVIPAFYWTVLILREIENREESDWRDVSTILRNEGSKYLDIWMALVNKQEHHASVMLAYRWGPYNVRNISINTLHAIIEEARHYDDKGFTVTTL